MKPLIPLVLLGTILKIASFNFSNGVKSVNPKDTLPTVGALNPGTLFPADNTWNTNIYTAKKDTFSDIMMKNEIDAVPYPDSSQFVRVELATPYYVLNHAPTPISIRGNKTGYDNGDYTLPIDGVISFPELKDKAPQISDPHICMVDTGTHTLYELYRASMTDATHWAHNGAAVFDLKSNALHSADGYTSADAAGLPILPGLVRMDELSAGQIKHALRITVRLSLTGHVYPATHHPNTQYKYKTGDPVNWLPMGARLRLRSTFDTTGYSAPTKVILECLKQYGAIVADIGMHFAISGTDDLRFATYPGLHYYGDDSRKGGNSMRLLNNLATKEVKWSDLEVVEMGKVSTLMH